MRHRPAVDLGQYRANFAAALARAAVVVDHAVLDERIEEVALVAMGRRRRSYRKLRLFYPDERLMERLKEVVVAQRNKGGVLLAGTGSGASGDHIRVDQR